MNCKRFNKLLVEYLYGELSGTAKRDFQDHASSCSACGRLLDEMEETVLLLKSQRPGAFSREELASLRLGVRREIAGEERRKEKAPRRRFFPVILQPRFAPVAASVVVALIAVVAFLMYPRPKEEPAPVEEVDELVVMTETIDAEFQTLAELCREIEDLQSLFPEETESDSEVELSLTKKAVRA